MFKHTQTIVWVCLTILLVWRLNNSLDIWIEIWKIPYYESNRLMCRACSKSTILTSEWIHVGHVIKIFGAIIYFLFVDIYRCVSRISVMHLRWVFCENSERLKEVLCRTLKRIYGGLLIHDVVFYLATN